MSDKNLIYIGAFTFLGLAKTVMRILFFGPKIERFPKLYSLKFDSGSLMMPLPAQQAFSLKWGSGICELCRVPKLV